MNCCNIQEPKLLTREEFDQRVKEIEQVTDIVRDKLHEMIDKTREEYIQLYNFIEEQSGLPSDERACDHEVATRAVACVTLTCDALILCARIENLSKKIDEAKPILIQGLENIAEISGNEKAMKMVKEMKKEKKFWFF